MIELFLTASDTASDFTDLSKPMSFTPGASNGERVCVNITVLSDGLVECEEDFTVLLTLNTAEDNIFLGNNSTVVTLLDSDGRVDNNNW